MGRSNCRISIVLVCSMSIFVATDRMTFGQAGSIGGTIGKTGKSVSGSLTGGDDIPMQRTSKPKKEKDAGCMKIMGTWNWVMGGTRIFLPNRTLPSNDRGGGTWTCSGANYVVKFNDGTEDRLRMSSDGNSMSGISSTSAWILNFTVSRRE